MKHNTNLVKLSLSSNNLCATFGFKLAEKIQKNKTLLYLHIDRNSIPVQIVDRIEALIKRNLNDFEENTI
jgi:hypothetical protein